MLVLKFGGTSVGSPERMNSVAKIIKSDKPRIVVLSAVSGTTNSLVEISSYLYKGNIEGAVKLIDSLHSKYKDFVKNLLKSEAGFKKGNELIDEHFEYIRSFTKDLFTIHEEKAILAQGELISTALFHYYLEENGEKSVLLPALNFMRTDAEGEPDLKYISENLKKEITNYKSEKLFITQGYICRNAFGEVDNLKRGGSDYSASLIGAAIEADEIQIWTDIDGMHNNDPRIVKKTFPIEELSFDEAAELAYFGAKILHPSSVLPARLKNIPVRLLNTMQPEAKGTLISQKSSGGSIKAVAAKDGITAIKIRSGRMLMAYGFLRSVFEIFERYKTPIDMITTSEVAVSVTIDDAKHLDEILSELKDFATVEVDKAQTIICVVGDFLADKKGYAVKIFDSLKNIPIRMISYGGSPNNVSVLVETKQKNDALNALNDGLFNSGNK
ncbi:MAG: Lysine-sensitive aspartokinase 3 [Bacteroidia bacterium]|nr:Lysine-sensitive aspartokinase 3 [Bacteroidia bacterium]